MITLVRNCFLLADLNAGVDALASPDTGSTLLSRHSTVYASAHDPSPFAMTTGTLSKQPAPDLRGLSMTTAKGVLSLPEPSGKCMM